MEELNGKIKLAEMRSDRVSSFLEQVDNPQEKSQVDEAFRDAKYTSEVSTDSIWVWALHDAGLRTKVILKV